MLVAVKKLCNIVIVLNDIATNWIILFITFRFQLGDATN
ncbi:MAG: hypothetical protein JWQ34_2586 [Mucilaginibacter sp.]|nr:hypothetical protein [Mucilaginibacter sp.]